MSWRGIAAPHRRRNIYPLFSCQTGVGFPFYTTAAWKAVIKVAFNEKQVCVVEHTIFFPDVFGLFVRIDDISWMKYDETQQWEQPPPPPHLIVWQSQPKFLHGQLHVRLFRVRNAQSRDSAECPPRDPTTISTDFGYFFRCVLPAVVRQRLSRVCRGGSQRDDKSQRILKVRIHIFIFFY